MIARTSLAGSIVSLLMLAATFGVTQFLTLSTEQKSSFIVPIEELPHSLGSWTGVDRRELGPNERQTLQLDSAIRRTYTTPGGKTVFLYIGYWKKQSGEHQAAKHSPVTCLPANGWKIFSPVTKERESLAYNELTATFHKQSMLFNYWFFSGTKTYAQEWKALLNISLGNFREGRTDGGIVEIYTPTTSALGEPLPEGSANAVLEEFMQELNPVLMQMIESSAKQVKTIK